MKTLIVALLASSLSFGLLSAKDCGGCGGDKDDTKTEFSAGPLYGKDCGGCGGDKDKGDEA